MQRRKFSREFKIEAVRLIKERGVAVAQASRDLDVHENVFGNGPGSLLRILGMRFPGMGMGI